MNHYSPETRQKVEADIDTELKNLKRDPESLLRDIFHEAHNAQHSESGRLNVILGRIAVLICNLDKRAAEIQKVMVGITFVMAFLTAFILWLTWKLASAGQGGQ